MSNTIKDAAGRTLHIGDIAGGTTSGRYQATIIGPITRIGTARVQIHVTSEGGDGAHRPAPGAKKWIEARRVFLVTPKHSEDDA